MPVTAAERDPGSRSVDVPLAVALGFVPVTLLDAALVLRGGGAAALEHLAFVVGYRALLAVVLVGVAALVMAARRRYGPVVAAAVLLVVSLAFGAVAFADDFYSYPWPQRVGLTVMLSLSPAGLVVLRLMAGWLRRWPGWMGVARAGLVGLGLLAGVANHVVIPYGNPGPHLGLLLLSGVGVAMALVGLRWGMRPAARRVGLGLAGALGLASVLARPGSDASLALSRDESAALYPFVYGLWPRAGSEPEALDLGFVAEQVGDPRWFVGREDAPAVAPTRPLVDAGAVIVVVVTIDALRHDVFADPRYAGVMPALQGLRAQSTVFTRAHASSSSTAPSIGSIFTGRYLSQMEWSPVAYMGGKRIRYYPVNDRLPRVPELLPARVDSYTVPSIERLRQKYALLRGFREEAEVDTREDLMAAEVMPGLIAWLQGRPGAALAYVHLMDAHSPYTSAGTQGSVFERYVREFGPVDAQLGALVRALEERGLWSRTVLIVAADHGEAFGEHGQTQHGGSLHEELTHIPLLIRVPGQAGREVAEPVSLIDLGPTILDLFQQPTPGAFLGQSLVPLLAGEEVRLDRPIALESTRLHRAIVFRDRLKCIWRSREDQFELYDLERDPGELVNILEREPSAGQRMAAVRRFFAAHAFVRAGYVAPHYW